VRAALSIPARANYLADLRTWIDQFVQQGTADEIVRARVVLAVHEVAANIIEHAYAGHPAGSIAVTAVLTTTQLTVSVDHTGEPCPRAEVPAPVFDGSASRGFGVWITDRAADDVYRVSGAGGIHSTILVHNLFDRTQP